MKQIEFFDIPSPCIGVCESGPKGYCLGCFRSRDERVHWHNLDDDVKKQIIKACVLRKRRAKRAKMRKLNPEENPDQFSLFDDQ